MPTYRRVQDIAHNIGIDGFLFISVTSADVRLTATDGTQAQLHATFEVDAPSEAEADAIFESSLLTTEPGEGRLHVAEGDGSWGMGSAIDRLVRAIPYLVGVTADLEEIEGTAPAGCRLELRAVSGDVQASGFRGAQRYQSVSGDLSAEAPIYDSLRIQSVSGDVSVDGELSDATPHAVDTVSGDFRLASASGMTVAVRGLSSDIHSALPHRFEGSADRRRLIIGDGAASVAFNSMSGDLAVTRSRQQAQSPAPATQPAASASETDRIAVLGALERGEIDVDEAMRRLGDRA